VTERASEMARRLGGWPGGRLVALLRALCSCPDQRGSRILFAVFLFALLLFSLLPRVQQYQAWLGNPSDHWVGEISVVSADSYYWLRIAREIRAGETTFDGKDPHQDYPDGRERTRVPALSWLVAAFSPIFEGDVYRTGIWLSIVLSSLFIIPLGLYGLSIGYPIAGLLGGAVGTFSSIYMLRTSVSNIDTEGGNLCFVWLLAWTIVSVRPGARLLRNLVYSALAGLCLAAFCRWYEQPGFWLAYAFTFALHLIAARFPLRQAVQLALLFAVCSNPLNAAGAFSEIVHFLNEYVFAHTGASTPLDYASITQNISELQPLPVSSMMASIVDAPGVAAIGLVGFAALAVFQWRRVVALVPILALSALALWSARRFAIYLAPLVGLGWGFLLSAFVRCVVRAPSERWLRLVEAATYGVAALGFLLLLGRTGYDTQPRTPISREFISSLRTLREQLEPDAAILTSWDWGYVVAAVSGAATFDDGKSPDPIVQYLYSRAITGDDPEEFARIAGFLGSHSRDVLHGFFDDRSSPEAGLASIAEAQFPVPAAVHLLFTKRGVLEFAAHFRTGQWDFKRGRGPKRGYDVRLCNRTRETTFTCVKPGAQNLVVDIEGGTIQGNPLLRRCIVIRDGVVQREIEYPNQSNSNTVLQLIDRGSRDGMKGLFLDEVVYRSNFNQMYVLGKYDPTRFEEVYDDFPETRTFRLKP
jgi:undecaprenyl-diphosphooligosaccharide--protein glycosyltransferase